MRFYNPFGNRQAQARPFFDAAIAQPPESRAQTFASQVAKNSTGVLCRLEPVFGRWESFSSVCRIFGLLLTADA